MGAGGASFARTDILIVGAGPTGLGAAWRLEELSHRQVINPALDWLLTDKCEVPGGMAASVIDSEGFTWDLGGHVIYSHYEYFNVLLDELLGSDLLRLPRKGWVWMAKRFIPFPLQHNLHHLPPADAARCLKGLLSGVRLARSGEAPENFAEWLQANFGQPLSELFFLPYNFKMWAHPASALSTVWTTRKSGSRYANVPLVDVGRLVENVVCRRDDPGWAGATTFPYPRQGGIGTLWLRAFQRLLPERTALSQHLVALDPERQVATFVGGLQVQYRYLISSIPLPELLSTMPEHSPAHRSVTPLRCSRSHIVGIGVRGALPDALRDKYWIHFPDPAVPFYRATVISNYSPNNVPRDGLYWSLLCETSESPHKPVDEERLVEDVERSLRASLLPPHQAIVSRWYRRLEYGYPVPCLDRDPFLKEIEPHLQCRNIRSRGRFGGWKYETSNQDNGFMQGVEAVDSILFGAEEISYFYPELVSEGAVRRILPI